MRMSCFRRTLFAPNERLNAGPGKPDRWRPSSVTAGSITVKARVNSTGVTGPQW